MMGDQPAFLGERLLPSIEETDDPIIDLLAIAQHSAHNGFLVSSSGLAGVFLVSKRALTVSGTDIERPSIRPTQLVAVKSFVARPDQGHNLGSGHRLWLVEW